MLHTVVLSSAFKFFYYCFKSLFLFALICSGKFGTSHSLPAVLLPLLPFLLGERKRVRAPPIWDLRCYRPRSSHTDSVPRIRTWGSTGEPQCRLPNSLGLLALQEGGILPPNWALQTPFLFLLAAALQDPFLKHSPFGRRKDCSQVPISPSDFLLKGSVGEYLQSKWSAEIVFWCPGLISWAFSGVQDGRGRQPTVLPPQHCLVLPSSQQSADAAFWKVDSVKWYFLLF